ncbi:hypothetical protein BDN72DRAFT_848732 [Pluteus cervinus]|uniref:Uncharacterized protein n=1 Tax=Pluteus cervinus TaxID=181527 RepID=A0ACD3A9W1_9AGAR|nr:hypothetical protein BDN72DRAFT_848732 [Pluteus cervinus]
MINQILPNELWEHVFLNLDYPSVLRCQRVCRLFGDIITSSAEVQYRGELSMDGMVDTGWSNLPVKQRLALLRERRSAWDNLQWELFPEETIPNVYHAYDFVDGTYAIIRNHKEFTAVIPPTKTTEGRRLTRHLEFSARDFSMDPTQDVIIFLGEQDINNPTIYLHVRSYESMSPHPQSEQSRIPVNCQERPYDCLLQVVDDLFALSCNDTLETKMDIRIWNWKTGKLIFEKRFADVGIKAESFTFINSQAFAIADPSENGYIGIYDLSSGTEVSRLHFPELADGALQNIDADTPPFFANPWSDRVFMTSPRSRIHTFSLSYWCDEGDLVLRAYLKNEILLSHATPRASEADSLGPRNVRWEDWGPKNTRIREMDPMEDSHCFSHGLRLVLPLEENYKYLRVLDFNFPRKLADNPNQSKSSVVSVTSPTTISYPSTFKEDIVTHLPYTMHLRVLPTFCPDSSDSTLILSESHIVVINEFDRGDESDLCTMAF